MTSRLAFFSTALIVVLLQGCGPRIPIAPGTPVSNLVLTSTGTQARFDHFILDDRSYSPSMFSFDVPAGHHSVGIRFTITTSDWCHAGDQVCNVTSLFGECTGTFTAEPNESYRILLDTRNGSLGGSIQKRSGSTVYLGQDEDIIGPLTCKNTGQKEQRAPEGLITF